MRFNRDKRGYENTFVVHSDRRKGRSQQRILYWYRSPPGVKVGRAALDEDAIRLIEQHNPDVEFDWTRILKAEPPESAAELRPVKQPTQSTGRRPASRAQPSGPAVAPPAATSTNVSSPDQDAAASAAEARLGSAGVSRLRGRYAEMLARIDERVSDPERRAELKGTAERLNPDVWVTETDVSTGLDGYERTFESLRAVVGHRRRRGRRDKPRGGGSGGAKPPNESAE